MIRYLLFGILVLSSSAQAETIWWRSTGAAVIQESQACALYIYNNTQAAIVAWNKRGPESISFDDDTRFRFGDHQALPIEVYINDALLQTDTMAVGNQTMVAVAIRQTDDELRNLLKQATKITGRLPDIEISIEVSKAKMPALLTAVDKCRASSTIR